MPQSIVRISRFDNNGVSESSVRHKEYGRLVSDVMAIGKNRIELTTLESAAIDSMITMTTKGVKRSDSGETEVVEAPDDNHAPKLSSWITHHQAIFGTAPTEQYFNVSAHVITDLMEKLGCAPLQLFPTGMSGDVRHLEGLFMTAAKGDKPRQNA